MLTIEGKTLEQWHEQIDALTIEDLWQDVMPILYPNQRLRNKNKRKVQPKTYYQRIDVFQMVDGSEIFSQKLSFQNYRDEETADKATLKDAKTSEFTALQNKQDIIDILADVELRIAIDELGLDAPNPSRYLLDLIQSGSITQAEALRDAYNNWKQEQDLIKQEDAAIEDGIKTIIKGQKIVAYINYLNRQKGLTVEQFQTILLDADLQLIERLCLNGSVSSARFQISQYVPDGVIMLEDDKTKILAFIDRV